MNIKDVLLLGLNEPEYSRLEFWEKHQKESGFSEKIFWLKLTDCFKQYEEMIEGKINELISLGNNITNYSLPLLFETDFRIKGQLGRNELSVLRNSLIEWAETKQLNKKIGTGEDSSNNLPPSIEQIKNNFDIVDIKEVYQHFKTGLVDKKYLSENDLLKFIDAAFDKNKPPEELFTLTDYKTKKKIIVVFKTYYRNLAQSPYGKQKKYASLLGDYFTGYNTKNVSTNFSR